MKRKTKTKVEINPYKVGDLVWIVDLCGGTPNIKEKEGFSGKVIEVNRDWVEVESREGEGTRTAYWVDVLPL